MLPSKAQVFWRYHFLLVAAICAILSGVAYCAGVVLLVNIRIVGQVRTALASDWIHIRATNLSAWQKCALVTIQDPGFFRDPGVRHSFRAAFTNTTITQVVVRKIYFTDYKPGITRIIHMLAACDALDRFVSKDDQLTIFANAASFDRSPGGESIIGFAGAAEAYFNKPFEQLSERQYLSLIAMLIDPTHLNPRTHPKENAERQAKLRSLLIDHCGATTGMP